VKNKCFKGKVEYVERERKGAVVELKYIKSGES
jgi:hypothetical protein